MSNNVVTIQKQATAIQTNFAPSTFQELMRFAEIASKSSFVPKDYVGKPSNVMIAVQMGAELGLAPMQSLQNIAVINNRPSIYGDAMLAVCKASPLCEWVTETIEGNKKEEWVAICTVKRKGNPEIVSKFSWQEAKDAQLAGKPGPWATYPKRMLQMRARGFALRDAFPDLLNGLISQEEAQDYPKQQNNTQPVQLQSKPIVETGSIQEMPTIEPEKPNLKDGYERLSTALSNVNSLEGIQKITGSRHTINLRAELAEKEPQWAGVIEDLVKQATDVLHSKEGQKDVQS